MMRGFPPTSTSFLRINVLTSDGPATAPPRMSSPCVNLDRAGERSPRGPTRGGARRDRLARNELDENGPETPTLEPKGGGTYFRMPSLEMIRWYRSKFFCFR